MFFIYQEICQVIFLEVFSLYFLFYFLGYLDQKQFFNGGIELQCFHSVVSKLELKLAA